LRCNELFLLEFLIWRAYLAFCGLNYETFFLDSKAYPLVLIYLISLLEIIYQDFLFLFLLFLFVLIHAFEAFHFGALSLLRAFGQHQGRVLPFLYLRIIFGSDVLVVIGPYLQRVQVLHGVVLVVGQVLVFLHLPLLLIAAFKRALGRGFSLNLF